MNLRLESISAATIRTSRSSDHKSLAELYLVSRRQTFHWMPKNHFRKIDFLEDLKTESCLVAELDTQIIGFVAFCVSDRFIHHLYVQSELHGFGIGKRLLEAALQHIPPPARLKCVIQNQRACAFYEKLGWSIESVGYDSPVGPYRNYRLDFI